MPINSAKEESRLIEVAIEEAMGRDARIHLITFSLKDDTDDLLKMRKKRLRAYADRFKEQGIEVSTDFYNINGEAREIPQRISEMANEHDLVIMGHYRFDRIYRFVKQSTAQDLMNMVSVPILIVPD